MYIIIRRNKQGFLSSITLKTGENRNFAMLKKTFSKHQLIKFSITHVYIKPEFDTKMIQ